MHYHKSLDYLFALIALIHFLAMAYSFVIADHYVIPTALLFNGLILGHLAYYGLLGSVVAKYIMFGISCVLLAHLFFSLFHVVAPRNLLGDFFIPIYSSAITVLLFLIVTYFISNRLRLPLKYRPNISR